MALHTKAGSTYLPGSIPDSTPEMGCSADTSPRYLFHKDHISFCRGAAHLQMKAAVGICILDTMSAAGPAFFHRTQNRRIQRRNPCDNFDRFWFRTGSYVNPYYIKSFSRSRDWRKIDANVPRGISRFPIGTITVRTSSLIALRYFAWLPFCEAKTKPRRSRTRTTSRDENRLGILKLLRHDRW